MPDNSTFDDMIRPLGQLITRFVNGEWEYPEFQRLFQPALKAYEKAINDRAYSPLDVIADIPEHCRSDLRKYCEEALERLPKESLDRSTRQWVESQLTAGGECFSFFDSDRRSRFGTSAALYSTPVVHDSFLLSSINGTIIPARFDYSTLLETIREVGGNEMATWVYGTEPDNAFASIENVWSLGDTYNEPYQLRRIERQPAPEGGRSFLMLLPKSKRWMLLNEYDYERFTITLHGSREFILKVAGHIDVVPVWEAAAPARG